MEGQRESGAAGAGGVATPGGPGGGKAKRRTGRTRAVAVLAAAALVIAGIVAGTWAWGSYDAGDAGATLVDLDTENMTRDEIQAALDEIVEANMMTISVAPNPVIYADGTVAVYVVNDESNTFDQRFSLIQEQDGEEVVLYESGLIEPGEMVTSCAAAGAVAGEAYIEIQAVVDGEDHGNPTRVKVTLVEAGE